MSEGIVAVFLRYVQLRTVHYWRRALSQRALPEAPDFGQGFWTVLPYRLVKYIKNLRLSPLGVVPQRNRRPRLIVDLSFYLVNQDCAPLSPVEVAVATPSCAQSKPQFGAFDTSAPMEPLRTQSSPRIVKLGVQNRCTLVTSPLHSERPPNYWGPNMATHPTT